MQKIDVLFVRLKFTRRWVDPYECMMLGTCHYHRLQHESLICWCVAKICSSNGTFSPTRTWKTIYWNHYLQFCNSRHLKKFHAFHRIPVFLSNNFQVITSSNNTGRDFWQKFCGKNCRRSHVKNHLRREVLHHCFSAQQQQRDICVKMWDKQPALIGCQDYQGIYIIRNRTSKSTFFTFVFIFFSNSWFGAAPECK